MKKLCIYVLVIAFAFSVLNVNMGCNQVVASPNLNIESPAVLLMELNSGQVLYEKDADTPHRPASVTKIMTMLLAFEALDAKKLHLEDSISISANAAGMGGSQVYLEEGETQTFQDLLKCMIVSSANDAATAVGEAIAGSEESFVALMNKRAKQLGMEHTHFENACGLEAKGHEMSARDIAILSRELLLNHPEVTDYTTIWMDSIVHKTKRGESEFGLANTNKFLKKYNGANGLKTGYTSAAGFSMSATATREGTTLIAVVMGAKTKDIRYSDAAKLLDYGFANCSIYEDKKVLDGTTTWNISDGVKKQIAIKAKAPFRYVFIGESSDKKIEKKWVAIKNCAPIHKGDIVAKIEYKQGGKVLGHANVVALETVEKQKYRHALCKIFEQYIHIY
ncbi:MAG: D-alanyl-D-alanine carboxypeptidase family protein [Eubacteriales bacterium]|nr:D-alanyl-D-alanine carboxypeptidase family protein [Eubacteriales bacterium]